MRIRNLFLLGCALLSGCVTGPKYTQGYEGSPLAADAVALVKPTGAISILSIDGKFIGARGIGEISHIEHEISVPPGRRLISVGYDDGARYSVRPVKLLFNAEPGRRYIVKHYGKVSDDWFRPVIQDVTSTPSCWTVKVGVFFGPKC